MSWALTATFHLVYLFVDVLYVLLQYVLLVLFLNIYCIQEFGASLRSLLLRRRVLVDQLKLLCFNSSEFASRLVCGDTCKIARIFRPVLLCDHRNETILSHALHPGGLP
jgi:hypothetical protein